MTTASVTALGADGTTLEAALVGAAGRLVPPLRRHRRKRRRTGAGHRDHRDQPGGRRMTALCGARVLTPTGVIDGGWVQVEAGAIPAVGPGTPPPGEDCRPGWAWLLPSDIDLHMHGGRGVPPRPRHDADCAMYSDVPHPTTATRASACGRASATAEARASFAARSQESGWESISAATNDMRCSPFDAVPVT